MKKIISILLLFYCSQAYSQKQTAFWHFGTFAGLDFNSGTPIAINNSQLSTVEGCASISDPNGQLLFYTDGITVWNKNNQIMLNGENLNGDRSSTNSAIIIPKPNDVNTYYIFTVDDVAGNEGLQYSEVNILLDGGLGAITNAKNILLYAPTLEKLTAVKHQNDTDWWVLTHNWNSNEFVNYRISSGGISSPITIPVGITVSGATANTIGCMKFSPDGSKIAIAHSYDINLVQLFDFDDLTGDITNPITLTGFNTSADNERGVYGIEFSPNSDLLYVTDSGGSIYQYNTDLPNSTDIINSKIEIENSTTDLGALQIAPDGKIYVAKENYNYLGVIESPNNIGVSSNYNVNGVFLNNGGSTLGLPPFIQSFFWKAVNVENTCFGDTTNFTLIEPEMSQIWNFGDPSSGVNNTSTDVSPTHVYTSPGTYSVEVQITNFLGVSGPPTIFNVVVSETPIANQPIDYVLCDNDDDSDYTNGIIQTFLLSTKDSEVLGTQDPTVYEAYHYEDSALTQKIDKTIDYENSSPNNQTIYVKIFNRNDYNCFDTTQFDLIVNRVPEFDLLEEKIICSNNLPDTVQPEDLQDTYDYVWTLDNGTVFSNNQVLTFNDVSSIPNNGLSLTLTATNQMNSCANSKSILIRKIIPVNFTQDDIIVNDLSDNNTITINPQDLGFNTSDYEFALADDSGLIGSYQSELIFENVTPGIKILYIRDVYGCSSPTDIEISIIGFPKYFTPNNDDINDTWQVLGVNQNFYSASIIKIFDRFGKLITTVSPNSLGWDGFYNGKELPETDYWFNVQLIDASGETREHNGHFSLIRR